MQFVPINLALDLNLTLLCDEMQAEIDLIMQPRISRKRKCEAIEALVSAAAQWGRVNQIDEACHTYTRQ